MRDVGKFYLEDGGRKNRMGKRWITDLALTMILLFLMGYSLIGEEIHEWLGLGMLLLMIFHHALNVSWYQNLKKGQYSPYRCVQTALTALLLFAVLGSVLSGLMLSQYVLDFLPLQGATSWPGRSTCPVLIGDFSLWGCIWDSTGARLWGWLAVL